MSDSLLITSKPRQSTDLDDASAPRCGSFRKCNSSISASIEQSRCSLLRAPDWRWELALDLVGRGRRGPRKSVDQWLLEAVRYQRDESRGASPLTLARRYPAVAAAHEIHRRQHAQRLLIEAWLLAGADDELIALETGTGPAVLEAYEQLFFNVRDRLRASDYVLNAIARSHRTDPHPRAETVQRLAYAEGPVVLKAILEAVGGSSGLLCGELPAPDLTTAKGRNQARIQLLLDIQSLDMDKFRASELRQLQQIARGIDSAALPDTRLCADWSVVWRQLPVKRTTTVDDFAKECRSTPSGWADLLDISQKQAA